MTDSNHPITPPPELVKQWLGTYFGATVTGEVSDVELALVHQAARWGNHPEFPDSSTLQPVPVSERLPS